MDANELKERYGIVPAEDDWMAKYDYDGAADHPDSEAFVKRMMGE